MSGNHHVCLSAGACSDLAWWCKSLEVWNGVSLMTAANKAVSDIILTSDASGNVGPFGRRGGLRTQVKTAGVRTKQWWLSSKV